MKTPSKPASKDYIKGLKYCPPPASGPRPADAQVHIPAAVANPPKSKVGIK
jgi:hypothetical protein